jgi:hypothetical protein
MNPKAGNIKSSVVERSHRWLLSATHLHFELPPLQESDQQKKNDDHYKDTDSINLRPDVVHIFNDPTGFTAAMVILDADKGLNPDLLVSLVTDPDLVYRIFSNPESYIRLSPNIVYISLKDETKTIMHSKLHVDLTFLKKRWLFWETAETVAGVFSWESTQYEVTLKVTDKAGSEIILTYHIGTIFSSGPAPHSPDREPSSRNTSRQQSEILETKVPQKDIARRF